MGERSRTEKGIMISNRSNQHDTYRGLVHLQTAPDPFFAGWRFLAVNAGLALNVVQNQAGFFSFDPDTRRSA
jgi:hypothetical protein